MGSDCSPGHNNDNGAIHAEVEAVLDLLVNRTCLIASMSTVPTRRRLFSSPAIPRSFSVPGRRRRSPTPSKVFLPIKSEAGRALDAHLSSPDSIASQSMSPKRATERPMMSFWQYILFQLTSSQNNDLLSTSISNMGRFASIPLRLERLLLIGFMVCLEEFLYIFTILPLRLILGFLLPSVAWSPKDLVRSFLILICCFLLSLLNVTFSTIYHLIRGQNFFKLYVLFNILTVFDKLCCSFGEDVLDALYANAQTRLVSRYTLLDLMVASGYTVIHTLVLYLQVVCLNVAMNSNTSTLVSLLSSNNFLELKSNVFKKYSKGQVFQITTSDIVERFHLILFAVVILVVNLSNIGGVSAASDWLQQATQRFAIVMVMEMLVDWVKHGCIIKFNSFDGDLFNEFRDVLYNDIGSDMALAAVPDASHFISRRIGFVSIPIAVVVLRGVTYSMWSALSAIRIQTGFLISVGSFTWMILLMSKLCLRLILLGMAAPTALSVPRYVQSYRSVERYSVFLTAPYESKPFPLK